MNSDGTPRSAGFVLTADDFAITGPVSRAILTLLEQGRISATGAMSNRPDWPASAAMLRAFTGQADLGVHLNLTCANPLTSMPGLAPTGELPLLKALLPMALRGALPEHEIGAEVDAQCDAFEQAMGMRPDFIDGHQHVHALPGLRDIVLATLTRRYPRREPYLRDSSDDLLPILKRKRNALKGLKINMLTRGFGSKARASGFATNLGFSGYSAFAPKPDFAADFASYLVSAGQKHLVMCHPGFVDDELARVDTALESREAEFAFFTSARFVEICEEAGIRPCRFMDV